MQAIQKNGAGVYAVIETQKGDIVLFLEHKKAPLTVSNFVGLAEGSLNKANPGKPFYDGLTFHRVEKGFVIQGGDPNGTGTGGPGYKFPNEIVADLKFTSPGILAMANAGPDTNGSQFFITHDATPLLNDKYSIFGHVIAGQEIVTSIEKGAVMNKVVIVREGADAQGFKVTQQSFDGLVQAQVDKNAQAAKQKEAEMAKTIDKLSEGSQKTASGLRYIVKKPGTGAHPKNGQTVFVHYEGRFADGTVFDSSYRRGTPIDFPVGTGSVIKGWDEALLGMKVGEQRTLIIPPALAYGERGYPGAIPPNSWLIFEVELVKIQ